MQSHNILDHCYYHICAQKVEKPRADDMLTTPKRFEDETKEVHWGP